MVSHVHCALLLAIVVTTSGCTSRTTSSLSKSTNDRSASSDPAGSPASVDAFLGLLSGDMDRIQQGLTEIENRWHPGQSAMLMEISRLGWGSPLANRLLVILKEKAGVDHGENSTAWDRDIWNAKYQPHPQYSRFKSQLYAKIDSRFAEYFRQADNATIRLDEIRWGGVKRDGIPPLKNPEMISTEQATYLADTDIVFGIAVGSDARAYPKRILAWHEMVKDVIGGLSLNGVYCTLCGSMIVYKTEFDGTHYELGTSGFLYRSNKLMYDHGTKSLWSTLEGEPCVGPLVGEGIRLQPYHVVTTTWGEWKRLHPHTRVLSLNTGHQRDYGEGVAYSDYFATDDLMFDVPASDSRLKNKDEVFIVRKAGAAPLAISLEFLRSHQLFHESLNDENFVVVTDDTGANRAYSTGGVKFARMETGLVIDTSGERWTISEHNLTHATTGRPCPRLPAHRAFWFGWFAAHPDTKLISRD